MHGLKGSLNNIGATALADEAYALELRAKDGDAAFCAAHLPLLAEQLGRLEQALAQVLAENEDAPVPVPPGDGNALTAGVADVCALLEVFESDDALEKLDALAGFDYGKETNARLRDAKRFVEEFEYDRAVDLLSMI